MNDFPVIGIAMAVPVIHLLLSFYSHLFPLFSGPAFFFLRKNMKQERPHGKGRKQRTLLMPSKNTIFHRRFLLSVNHPHVFSTPLKPFPRNGTRKT